MSIVFINGEFVPAEKAALSVANRAFRYADGCFEAVRIINGKPVFWAEHVDRLWGTLALLEIDTPFDHEQLCRWINTLLDVNAVPGGAMLRIMVFRQDGGTYFPLSNEGVVFMELRPLDDNVYARCPEGKLGGIFDRFVLPAHELGNHKTLNKTIHVTASVSSQKNGWDDAVILNHRGEIAEVISSNIYLAMEDRIITPSLDSGCLNGTIRKVLTANRSALPLPLFEEAVPLSALAEAHEVWTSNAAAGLQWFRQIGKHRYRGNLAQEVQEKLVELALSSASGFPGTRP